MDEKIDPDNGDDYYAVMEYVYKGVKYKENYKRFGSKANAEALIGK